ncbi:MAG TPA: phenylalanine--tRNA ligase beta subunit-related protein [Nitrososphaerales archaeon]|nr:phenylalanine--tRNA ligase beta subunit-related protein [Nitrososphaerales archaeon]
MMKIEPELEKAFPGLRVVELELPSVTIRKSKPELDLFKAEVERSIRDSVASIEEVKDQRIIRAYRDFYWKIGIDPTKTRPAGEALVRRIVSGKGLPTVNTLVDSYNLASAKSYVAIAAFDLSKIHREALLMRRSSAGEDFLGIGMDHPMMLSGKEIIIEDKNSGKLVALYPYRDSDDSKVTEETRSVLLMMCGVPGIEDGDLKDALELSSEFINRFCKVESGK